MSIYYTLLQDKFYSQCIDAFRGSEAVTHEDYLLIAQGQVASFLQLEDVCSWVLSYRSTIYFNFFQFGSFGAVVKKTTTSYLPEIHNRV